MDTEISKVSPVTSAARDAIKRKSAYSLPTNPSERGMSEAEIKRAFWAPVTESAFSVLSELDRVAEQTNQGLSVLENRGEERLTLAKEYTKEQILSYRTALAEARRETAEQAGRVAEAERILTQTLLPTVRSLQSEKAEKNNTETAGTFCHRGDLTVSGAAETANLRVSGTIANPRLQAAYETLAENKAGLLALRSEAYGRIRAFCLPDFLSLVDFLRNGGFGTATVTLPAQAGGGRVYASDLRTGDILYIQEEGVPDFWWIATDSAEGADTHSYGGTVYPLVGYASSGGDVAGRVVPLESDYAVVAAEAVSASASARDAARSASESAVSAGEASVFAAQADQARLLAEKQTTEVRALLATWYPVRTEAELRLAAQSGIPNISLSRGADITLTKRITFPCGTVLRGNGATIRRATGYEDVLLEFAENCRVSNLTVDGNREAMVSPAWSRTIEITVRENCVIEQVTVQDGNEAIICYGGDCRVENCRLLNCGGNGIHFSGADRVRVADCKVIGANKRSGMGHENGCIIWSNECRYIDCENNYCEDGLAGFGSLDSACNSYAKILGNTVRNCTYAVNAEFGSQLAEGMHHLTVSDNQFFDSGMVLVSRTVPVSRIEGVVISDNMCRNTVIRLQGVFRPTVMGNNLDNRGLSVQNSSVALQGCVGAVVSGNTVIDRYLGIYIADESPDAVCTGNQVSSVYRGIMIGEKCHNSVVVGNRIRQTETGKDGDYGIFLLNARNVKISENVISLYGGIGILVGSHVTCTGNTILMAEDTGIAIRCYGGEHAYIVTQNMTNATFAVSTGENSVIEDNLINDYNDFFTVTFALTHLLAEGGGKAMTYDAYTCLLAAEEGYCLPECVSVSAGDTVLSTDMDYTYDAQSGKLTVFAVRDNLTVTATAAEEEKEEI